MRNGLLVFFGLIAVSTTIALLLAGRYREDLTATQDVVLGLIYFMEQHGGRLPASEAEFRSAAFVEPLPDGAIRITPPPQTRFRRQTHGIPIRDLAPFRIRWGTELGALTLSADGKAHDAEGRTVELAAWPSSPSSGKGYTVVLLAAWQEIRSQGAAATGPSKQPLSTP